VNHLDLLIILILASSTSCSFAVDSVVYTLTGIFSLLYCLFILITFSQVLLRAPSLSTQSFIP
jgi:hypothetical protein